MKTKIFKIAKNNKSSIWSLEEDDLLRNHLKIKKRNKWQSIAERLNNKSLSQIYLRSHLINPNLKKGKFSKEEDEKLKGLVNCFGHSWSLFSKLFKNRNSKQLRLRYINHLRIDFSKKKFTSNEDEKILSLFQVYRNQWSSYVEHLPNRSFNKIKYRCKTLLKEKIKSKIKLKEEKFIENEFKEIKTAKNNLFAKIIKKQEIYNEDLCNPENWNEGNTLKIDSPKIQKKINNSNYDWNIDKIYFDSKNNYSTFNFSFEDQFTLDKNDNVFSILV